MSSHKHRTWQRAVPVYDASLNNSIFWFFLALALVSSVLAAIRMFGGLAFTGMTDEFAWGVWKTFNVMTLTALGSSGLAIGVVAWVFNQHQFHVVMRSSLVISLLFYATGLVSLGIDVGRPWNFYNTLLPWRWNYHSSLFEVAICMTAYVTIFLLYENLPPFVERRYASAPTPMRRRISQLAHKYRAAYPFMIALAYLLPIMHQSSLGSLMVIAGPKVHPLWQTQMLPAYYLLQAFICGFAAVIVILMISSLAWRRPLDMPILGDLGKFMAGLAIGFVTLRWIQVLVTGKAAYAFSLDSMALLFHLEMLLNLVPALFLLKPRVRLTPRWLFTASALIAVGGMLYRFSPTTLAYRAGSESLYFPSDRELLLAFGAVGWAVVLFMIIVKYFAVLPAPLTEWYAAVEYAKEKYPQLRIDEHGAATDY